MTIKEIAELCGVDQSTVNRWIHDPACKMSLRNSVKEKLEIGVPAKTLTS